MDGIPSFVDCSLLRTGNHTLHQKSWGGPSEFWGSRPPNPPPVVAPLNLDNVKTNQHAKYQVTGNLVQKLSSSHTYVTQPIALHD